MFSFSGLHSFPFVLFCFDALHAHVFLWTNLRFFFPFGCSAAFVTFSPFFFPSTKFFSDPTMTLQQVVFNSTYLWLGFMFLWYLVCESSNLHIVFEYLLLLLMTVHLVLLSFFPLHSCYIADTFKEPRSLDRQYCRVNVLKIHHKQ